LASPQGGGVIDSLLAILPRRTGVFRTGMGAAAGGTAAGGAAVGGPRTGDGGWDPDGSLADPWSQGDPGAYPFRIEYALVADGQSWRYTGFAFRGGRFVEAAGDCCPDGRDRNSAILGHAFHLAVEGGTNRGTGLRVAGAGPAHRELIAQIFHRARTELLPPAISFPLAAEAIRQSAADLAPDTVVQRAVEQALEAVGLPPLAAAEGSQTGSAPDNDTGERPDTGSPTYAAFPSEPPATAGRPADFDQRATEVGHYNYESPHSNPVALLPDGSLLYAANTPADTVDVVDTATRTVVARIDVGLDPVGVAVRPDGREVWVANHVSDSVSVIDADPASPTRHHVLATVQVFDAATRSTRFDEPVGIAFAGNAKAYVALSSSNRVAVVDVAARAVTKFLPITAQDPRQPVEEVRLPSRLGQAAWRWAIEPTNGAGLHLGPQAPVRRPQSSIRRPISPQIAERTRPCRLRGVPTPVRRRRSSPRLQPAA
jgi:YVTN family beta-propeller protein